MAGAAMEVCEELVFHGVEYILSVSVGEGQVLLVDVEKKEDGERWHGEFSASYIEEVTQKTGNFKKFSVFVKMLTTSLKRDQKSETVFADLLTYSDLEMLRSRQTRKPLNTAARPNNKRYLILTYAVEFDRVHYPLPLMHVDEPPAQALNATIRRLREEIKQLQATGYSQTRSQSDTSASRSDDSIAHDLRKRNEKLREENEKLREETVRLNRAKDQLSAELERKQEGSFESEASKRQLKEARRRVTELENELANEQEEARAEQEELRRQLVILQREVDAGKQTILDLKGRVREISQHSDVAVRRARLEADPRLDHKRAIYGSNPNSRPSSAERRRPSPAPARPFQRFDPTAYVKDKEKVTSLRARSSSPRPGVPPPSASASGSRASSRPSSAERLRPASSSSRPASAERQRPWAEPPRRGYSPSSASASNARPPTQPSSRPSSRPASAERQRPAHDDASASSASRAERARPASASVRDGASRIAASSSRDPPRASSRDPPRERPSASSSTRSPQYGGGATGASPTSASYRRPLSAPSPNRAPASADSSPGPKLRNAEYGKGGEGRRAERERSGDEENRYPRGGGGAGSGVGQQKFAAAPVGESGDEISDIDARLNALQSFLQAAKAKAKAAGGVRR